MQWVYTLQQIAEMSHKNTSINQILMFMYTVGNNNFVISYYLSVCCNVIEKHWETFGNMRITLKYCLLVCYNETGKHFHILKCFPVQHAF